MRITLPALLAGMLALAACDGCKDPEPTPDASNNTTGDAGNNGTPDADMAKSDMPTTPDMNQPDMSGPATRVEIDLEPYFAGNMFDDGNPVRVFQATTEADLVTGEVASSRIGDWVLENGTTRFIVEGDDRSMSACPYGGHIIDGAPLDKPNDGDMIGEVCLMINAGSTLVPEMFEVLEDGSNGVGVLAVTGRLDILDWINFNTMAADLGFGGIGELRIGPNRVPPVTATVYYILRPGERGLLSVIALRNDGSEQQDLFIGSLMGGGGDGSYWNPISSKQGYGTSGLSLATLEGEPMPLVGYGGGKNSSWAYVPKPNMAFDGESLPQGGVYLAISNIVVAGLDVPSILQIMIATDAQLPTHPGLAHVQPGETTIKEHWMYVGDGSMSTIMDQAYPSAMSVGVGTVSGQVLDANSQPAANAIVTAIDSDGSPMSQQRTGADGNFSFSVPSRDYMVHARIGNIAATPVSAMVARNATVSGLSLTLPSPATATVHVRDPSGNPVAGRVTVLCDVDPCPGKPPQAEIDLETDRLPPNWAGVYPVDVTTGDITFDLPEGPYRIVVTKGMGWSVWPPDGIPDGGYVWSAVAGQTDEITAEIAPVVDKTGLIYTDFHVHTVSSHDSEVPHIDRIAGFVADGLDVCVSSDHDIIADYGPAVVALGAQNEIATVVGLEITTSDLGHYNAFPLQQDPAEKRGGSLDWANGPNLSLLPADILAWIDAQPGEQVVQVNHADSLGFIKSTLGDPLRGISLADPSTMRLPAATPDPVTGDTGLWTDAFTSFEVSNGNDLPQTWALFRWWLTMIGRGFSPSGTAVTDTHHRWSDVGSTPRSIVTMPVGSDTAATFDEAAFVTAVNAGRVVGTNGPTLRVSLRNSNGDHATYGEILDAGDGEATAEVSIQMPEWMSVDTIDVYTNLDTVITEPGKPNEDPVVPSMSVPITIDPADLVVAATGTEIHRRVEKTVEIPLTITEDAYFVFIVRGNAVSNMVPLLSEEDTYPFAFTNPIFADFDGNGYDHPPLAAAAKTPPPRPAIQPGFRDVTPTAEQLLKSIEGRTCTEDFDVHDAKGSTH